MRYEIVRHNYPNSGCPIREVLGRVYARSVAHALKRVWNQLEEDRPYSYIIVTREPIGKTQIKKELENLLAFKHQVNMNLMISNDV